MPSHGIHDGQSDVLVHGRDDAPIAVNPTIARIGVGLVVLMIAFAGLQVLNRGDRTDGADGTAIQVAPRVGERLRVAPSRLPTRVDFESELTPLAADPPGFALALLHPAADDNAPSYVLGLDGRLRVIDLRIGPTRDADGNTISSVGSESLRPDGRAAAFPQLNAVVTIDMATGNPRWYRVAGYNERVRWHPDGVRLLVARADGPVLLHTETGDVTPIDPGDRQSVEWLGGTHTRGGRVAVAEPHAVAISDAATGERAATLVFPDAQGCCPVLGWLDDETVAVGRPSARKHEVLAWNVRSKAVTKVTEISVPATVSLATDVVAGLERE